MSNIVFRKQASKGALNQAHVKAFNEAPNIREEGLTTLKGWKEASAHAKQVAHDKIYAQEAVNQLEAKNREEVRLAEVKDRERVFAAIQHNRKVKIGNLKTEADNYQRKLKAIGNIIGASVNIGVSLDQLHRKKIDQETNDLIDQASLSKKGTQDVLQFLNSKYETDQALQKAENDLINKYGNEGANEIFSQLLTVTGRSKESLRRNLARDIAEDPSSLIQRFQDKEINIVTSSGPVTQTIAQAMKTRDTYAEAGSDIADGINATIEQTLRQLAKSYLFPQGKDLHNDSWELIRDGIHTGFEKGRSQLNERLYEGKRKAYRDGQVGILIDNYNDWKKRNNGDPTKSWEDYFDSRLEGLNSGTGKKARLSELLSHINQAVQTGDIELDDAIYAADATLQAHGAKKGEKRQPIHRFAAAAVEDLRKTIASVKANKISTIESNFKFKQAEQKRTILELDKKLDSIPAEQQTPAFFQNILQNLDPSDTLVYNHVSAMAKSRKDTNDNGFRLAWDKDLINGSLRSNTIRKSDASDALKIQYLNKLTEWNKGQPKTISGLAQLKTNWEGSRDAIIDEYGYFGETREQLDSSVTIRLGMAEAKYHARVQHYMDKMGMSEGDASYEAYKNVLADIKAGKFKPIDRIVEGGGTAADLKGLTYTFDIESETPDSLYLQLQKDPKKIVLGKTWFEKYDKMRLDQSRRKSVNFGTLPLWNLVTFTASTTKDQNPIEFIEIEREKLNAKLEEKEQPTIEPHKNEEFDNNMNIFNEAYWSTSPTVKQAIDFGGPGWTNNSSWLLKYDIERIESGQLDWWRNPENDYIFSTSTKRILETQGAE